MTGELMVDHEELPEALSIGLRHILDEALVVLAVLETGSARLVLAPPKCPNCFPSLPADHSEQRRKVLALQLQLIEGSESMGDHDSGSDDWWCVG
jgi:hypothetical protein